jgi:hypothetical protein
MMLLLAYAAAVAGTCCCCCWRMLLLLLLFLTVLTVSCCRGCIASRVPCECRGHIQFVAFNGDTRTQADIAAATAAAVQQHVAFMSYQLLPRMHCFTSAMQTLPSCKVHAKLVLVVLLVAKLQMQPWTAHSIIRLP